MILSKWIIRNKIKGLVLQSKKRNHRFISLKDVQSLFLLVDLETYRALAEDIEALKKENKQVSVCLIVQGNEDYRDVNADLVLNIKHDLNWLGLPASDFLDSMKKFPANLFISLTEKESYLTSYLTLSHPAPMKIGINRQGDNIYDFSITPTEKKDIRFLFGQILFYLRTIDAK